MSGSAGLLSTTDKKINFPNFPPISQFPQIRGTSLFSVQINPAIVLIPSGSRQVKGSPKLTPIVFPQ